MVRQPFPKWCFEENLVKGHALFWLIPAISKVVETLLSEKRFFMAVQNKSHGAFSSNDCYYTKGQQIGY